MNILIISNGGREHALAWKAARSTLAVNVYVAPGNAGTALEPTLQNADIAATNIPALGAFAQERHIGLDHRGTGSAAGEGGCGCFPRREPADFWPNASRRAVGGFQGL